MKREGNPPVDAAQRQAETASDVPSGGRDLSTAGYLALLGTIGLASLALRGVDLATIPPGLHFDQAANGLLALEILQGKRPVFFSAYTGREAFFMYLVAAISALLGPGVVALRLASALAGVATVIALAFLGASLYGRRVGIAAAAFLGGLYWHVHVSRLGERAITVPLLDVLATLAFWEGFRRRSMPLVALGGGLVGLQLDTYPSSRFFVLVVAGVGALEVGLMVARQVARAARARPEGASDRGTDGRDALASSWRSEAAAPRRDREIADFGSPPGAIRAGLLATAAALLVATPLALHFLHRPEDFLGRADQVAIWNPQVAGPAPLAALVRSTVATLQMFVRHGDTNWKYNLAGQPVFEPVSAGLFLVGLAGAVRGWRDRANRFCLIWWLGMLGPGFLSVDAPQFMRTIGAAPPAALLAARGLAAVVLWVACAPPPLRAWAPVGWGWPLVAASLAAYHYFAVWAPSPAAYLALEGDVTAAAGIIRALSPSYAATYVASRYGADPTESFLDSDLFGRLRWFDGRSALPLPPPGSGPTLYVLPRTAVDPAWYERLPATQRVAELTAPDGGPAVEAFVLDSTTLRPTGNVADLGSRGPSFGGVARLVAADVPPLAQPGLPITPTFFWQIERLPDQPLRFFVHLVDSAGEGWAQFDEEVYPAAEWQVGQIVVVRRSLPIPVGVPLGRYTLQIGLERPNGDALAVRDAAGHSAGTSWQSPAVGMVRPPRPPDIASLDVGRPADVVFGGTLKLIGSQLAESRVQDGDTITLTLFWQVLAPAPGGVDSVVQAIDARGAVVGETVRPPTGGVWPWEDWQPGDVLVDRQHLLLPAGTAPGPLILAVGLRTASGQPLAPLGRPVSTVPIGTVALAARPRSFASVNGGHPLNVAFADGIRLLGYDLEPTLVHAGEPLQLRLYWQTDRPVTRSWTVFTHLLDGHEQIRAQQDGLPAAGHRPTTTWAPGETIADAHTLVVQENAPPGVDRIEVGLYDLATGVRLTTTRGDDRVLLDRPVEIRPREIDLLDRSRL